MNLPTTSEALEPVARRLSGTRARRLGIAATALLIAIGIGLAGYAIGKTGGVDSVQADAIESAAYESSFDLVRAQSAKDAADTGASDGARAGREAGESAGARRGASAGAAAVKRTRAAIAEQRAAEAAAAAAAAARRAGRRTRDPVATTPTTPVVPTPVAPAPAPAPAPEPAPAPTNPDPPCFDASGHPC